MCLCAWIAVSSAGFIGYPASPFGYYGGLTYPNFVAPSVPAFFPQPAIPYNGLLHLSPSYLPYGFLPESLYLPGDPGIIGYGTGYGYPYHFLPPGPDVKNKDKKKGDEKETVDDKKDEKKEEVTEEPKKEELKKAVEKMQTESIKKGVKK